MWPTIQHKENRSFRVQNQWTWKTQDNEAT